MRRSRYRMPGLMAGLACLLAVVAIAGSGVPAATPTPTALRIVETPHLRVFGPSDGLPSSSVNALAQDAQGYLWLATDDGLARYDGVGFKVWQHDPADPGSLPGNLVQALHVDGRGRVWVAMEGHGVALLLPDGEHFRRYDHTRTPGLGEDDVFAITSTADGALWIGTFGGGLYRLDGRGALAHYLPHGGDRYALPDANVIDLKVDPQGRLWVATTAGAARWTGRGFDPVDAPGIRGATVFAIDPLDDGQLLFATRQGLFLRAADGAVRALDWNPNADDPRVTGVLRDRNGGWWLAVPGLLRRTRSDLGADVGSIKPVPIPGVATQRVMAMLQDRQGNLWFATRNGGLLQLPPQALRFASFRHQPDQPTSLGVSQPEGIADAGDGRLWVVGGRGGIDLVDTGSGTIAHWQPPALVGKYLWAVARRGDGPLWIGYNTGIARADPRTHALQTWEQGAASDAALAGPNDLIAQTPDGRVWISSLGAGLQIRDGRGHVLITIRPGDGHGLNAADAEQLAISPQGALWLAGAQGLLAWNEAAQRFAPVPGAPRDRVDGFAFADPHTLWLHRFSALERYRWDGHGLSLVQRIGADKGLPAVDSGGVLADAQGAVWLTTTRGLLRLDPHSGRVRRFGVRDGLPSQEFGRHPPLLTRQGLAAAAASEALVLFQPGRFASTSAAPALVIESMDVHRGDRVLVLDPHAKIELGPDDRDLQVNARLLSFLDPKANHYRFFLHGFDADWREGVDGQRTFSRLDPGHYRLAVEAVDADGRRITAPELTLVVDPPWWRTTAAYLVWAGLVVLALWLLAWAYRRRLRQRHEFALAEQRSALAEQNSEAKSRFLASMGHEIRTPMTGVLGMTELLLAGPLDARQRGQAESIERAGRHLLRIVNDALDLARIEAGKLSLEPTAFDPRQLLAEVDAMLRPQAADKQLRLDTHVVADLPRGLRGDPVRVRQIVLNLGHNAIKFSERGGVRIVFSREPATGALRITVSDTGPGMDAQRVARLFQRFEQGEGAQASAPHGSSGLGLAICRELAAAMAGSIDVDSTPGVGTRFDVLLPLPEAEVPAVAVASAPAPAAKVLSLLLVDDDPIVAAVLEGLLRLHGHAVVRAAHGLAALTEMEHARFDAALLDLDLPGVNGLDLARLIRARGMTLPLLAITARADAGAEADARAAGMDGFLRKPVSGEMLAAAIAALMRAR